MPVKLLTKTAVDRLPYTEKEKGVDVYYDTKLKGFGLRVSKTTKVYFAEGRVHRRTRRVKIGQHDRELSTEAARKKAKKLLTQMEDGIDPNATKRDAINRSSITLEKAFSDYLEARKDLKPKTIYDYKGVMRVCFPEWNKRALTDITKTMISKKHQTLGEKRGKGYANLAMRVLRAVFNFASARYDIIEKNPTKSLSETRSWYKIDRRRTVIKPHELPELFKALDQLKEKSVTTKAEVVRDYILFLIFTGLRRQEAAKLKWNDVDFKSKTITIEDTKNREPHTLPLSDYLLELLKRRHENRPDDNPYVFTGSGEKSRHIVEPRRQIKKITENSGVRFSIHDLRRTFASIAEGQVSAYQLKRFLNHKMSGDVTAGYIVTDVESLRPGMQKITDTILKHAGKKESGQVVRLYS